MAREIVIISEGVLGLRRRVRLLFFRLFDFNYFNNIINVIKIVIEVFIDVFFGLLWNGRAFTIKLCVFLRGFTLRAF